MSNQSLTIKTISFRLATPDDAYLPVYDHTALSNVNTCPTWGIIRYVKHKRMEGSARAMALEAGDVSHQVFAAHRLFQLGMIQKKPELMAKHGFRIFGEERFIEMTGAYDGNATERTNIINFCLQALYTSGYFDDPYDKYRTVTNIAESCMVYFDTIDPRRYPVWIRDPSDPNSDVGIEIAFDIVVDITFEEDVEPMKFRYAGRLDGVHHDKDSIVVVDNKTGARIDDAWLAQWQLSHQLTGYCIATSLWTGQRCDNARAIGMRIPASKNISETIRQEKVSRQTHLYNYFANWLVHTINIIRQYEQTPLSAPRYTHSCNRYFRPCSFLPLCYGDEEEQARTYEEMQHDEWSPLETDVVG